MTLYHQPIGGKHYWFNSPPYGAFEVALKGGH